MERTEITDEQWKVIRPEVELWYQRDHRTAKWMAAELQKRRIKVSEKMLYTRFREWDLPRRYRKASRQPTAGTTMASTSLAPRPRAPETKSHAVLYLPSNSAQVSHANSSLTVHSWAHVSTELTRSLNTPANIYDFHHALISVGAYLDVLTTLDHSTWAVADQGTALQRLVASAHMALTTQQYDAKAIWVELSTLEPRAKSIISTLQNPAMHPRVLTALLRLLVDHSSATAPERAALKAIRRMFYNASRALPSSHPVPLLCSLSLDDTSSSVLLQALCNQLNGRLYNKMCDTTPDFVAAEQVYGARVLASVGRTDIADSLLESVYSQLGGRIALHTTADYHRTAGYSKIQNGQLRVARSHLETAMAAFEAAGRDNSEGAMFTCLSLAMLCRKENNLAGYISYLEATLEIWDTNSDLRKIQSGIKFVRDLYQAYDGTHRSTKMHELEARYPAYFVKSDGKPQM
ncbi:hypothetical protein LTR15_006905 [Elasticomyces elasticus]|nr:hypothetical protein LTR15_006905 [Elasticomyces elasticus]